MDNCVYSGSEHGSAVHNDNPSTPETVLSHNHQHRTHNLRFATNSLDQDIPTVIHTTNRPYYYCF